MQDPVREALDDLGGLLDEELLPSLVAAATLDPAAIRAALDADGLAWHDPERGRTPELEELDATARDLVRRAARRATVRGAVAGLAGVASIPPEAVAALVQLTRLAQRLAVVYGHAPDTDRGRVWLVRALAEAVEVDLPRQGRWDLRLSHLRTALRRPTEEGPDRAAWLARVLALRAGGSTGERLLRLVPGLGSGLSAAAARRTIRRQGRRMMEVYRRSWEGALLLTGPVEDAVEVP